MTGAYDHLKTATLRSTTEFESSRLRRFLTTEEIGNRRPGKHLRRMLQFLGERPSESVNNPLRELFLNCLPANMRMNLISADGLLMMIIAEMADKIAEPMPVLQYPRWHAQFLHLPALKSRFKNRPIPVTPFT